MSGIGSTSGGLRAARPGFTLIEMLVVLAIMSLIAGIGFPAIERTIEVGRFRATATGIGTLLSQAHYAAIREGHDVRVFLGDGGRSITTDGGDSLDIQPPLTLRADDRTVVVSCRRLSQRDRDRVGRPGLFAHVRGRALYRAGRFTMTPARIRVPSEDGFALVETLIATAIVALMASMLFGIVIQDTRTRRALADRRLAVAIAQSHLEQAAVVGRSDDLPLSGTDQGFRWARRPHRLRRRCTRRRSSAFARDRGSHAGRRSANPRQDPNLANRTLAVSLARFRRRRATAGFTLVEMLVSLAILGMMATMLLGGLASVSRLSLRENTQAAWRERVISAQRLLREQLVLLSSQTRNDSSVPIVDANGDAGRFTFFAPPLGDARPIELQRYRITVTPAGTLVLYRAGGLDDRFDNLGRAQAGWQAIPLLDGVRSFEISYYGEDKLGRGRRWQTEWAFHPQPPDLIRIRATMASPDAKWPDLVVRPRSTLNTACEIDPLNGRCRSA